MKQVVLTGIRKMALIKTSEPQLQFPGDYLVMPEFTCFGVTNMLHPVEAALIEPLSIGVYAVNLSQIFDKNVSVAIFGAGPIGLSILMKLLAVGINNVGVIEPLEY